MADTGGDASEPIYGETGGSKVSWRLGLLETCLSERRTMETNLEDTEQITGLIDSLCIN